VVVAGRVVVGASGAVVVPARVVVGAPVVVEAAVVEVLTGELVADDDEPSSSPHAAKRIAAARTVISQRLMARDPSPPEGVRLSVCTRGPLLFPTMSRPALAAISLALVALAASPAAAQVPEEDARPVIPLSELIERCASEIRLFTGDSMLPPRDLSALRSARLARLDLTIGALRDEAVWTLRSSLPEDAVTAVVSLDQDGDPAGISELLAEQDSSALTMWRADALAAEWLELSSVIGRLRTISSVGPERVCPVPGETWFEDNWGADRPWGRSHKGIDLHADFAAPLAAVEDGVVVQANWHRSGGRQIYIRADSTGDVYYYAHLEYWEKWIWTGTRVEAGVIIGLLGDSGNADSPHLHFGWMPGSVDVDLDNLQNPYPLLLEVCS
jgi:murein DD-endopeptidase MepM/ murein hydrolase activator NlpD